jgi:hypothetical protein
MAKDCPEPKGGGPNAPPKAPRVELKERGVRQIGGASEKYDMVFDDGVRHRDPPAYDTRPAEYDREGDKKRQRHEREEEHGRGAGKHGVREAEYRQDRRGKGEGGADRHREGKRYDQDERVERHGERARDEMRAKNGDAITREDKDRRRGYWEEEESGGRSRRDRSFEGRDKDVERYRGEPRKSEHPRERDGRRGAEESSRGRDMYEGGGERRGERGRDHDRQSREEDEDRKRRRNR